VPQTQITIAGNVTPVNAVVIVDGVSVNVSATGEFKKIIQAPVDEGDYTISIEATYENQSRSVPRIISVKAQPLELKLSVTEPINKTVINKPLVKVSGIVFPASSEVIVSGIAITPASNGSFSKEIPLADEEGEVPVEINASYKEKSVTEQRTVIYKKNEEDIVIIIQSPTEGQSFCGKRILVSGSVRPSSITDIVIQGMTVPVRNGVFNDYILIAEEVGDQEVEFEVTGKEKSKTVKRIVKFVPASKQCNIDAPDIQPSALPLVCRTERIAFTIYDKTMSDEITFYTSIDGIKESETGYAGSVFYLYIEQGIHFYEIYATDLAGNRSQVLSGKISRLLNDVTIRMINPANAYHVIHIPPMPEDESFQSEVDVEFSVQNLPDDNPMLLKEIRVINAANNSTISFKKFTNDVDFTFAVPMKRGQNKITIEVRDVNDKIITKGCTIEIR